jgi:hypothetical protein
LAIGCRQGHGERAKASVETGVELTAEATGRQDVKTKK